VSSVFEFPPFDFCGAIDDMNGFMHR
jgi:hypothetical protein